MAVEYARPRRANITKAAEYAGCSERTLRNLVAAGKVPCYRLGKKCIRIDLDELDELMRSGVLGA
ncbi:helix-turn-helix domain-containing protein [Mycolicibacterium sp. D5.8-2]|uniref:helix-turn-helix domain-containing protein n=1 Tax=Mycolicibacterium sp. D5.8-2 TaxID=3085903 RepID=UPI00298D32F0|nr:helix-turn-helix domain-containing protein [Mycolicibacterium sp. D5.8-2]MDW5610665.1 helix-turn-helix domain-containing protein [Mycolicibacterium sp. D5.8-2]